MISVLIAVALHQFAAVIERLVLRRYAMTTD